MPQPNQKSPIKKPKLTNRGGAGLYGKLTPQQKAGIVADKRPDAPVLSKPRAKYQIAPELQRFAVPIDSIEYDPDNARLHPDGNVVAIKESLLTYGQVVPLVVQKSTNKVVAGNGRLRCARELGWKEIAVHFVDMSDAEAAGYGLADNKTAELAMWDFETDVLKRIYAKVEGAGLPMTGWKEHELIVLRMADWVPPELSDEDFNGIIPTVTIKCTGAQYAKIDGAMNEVHNRLVLEGKVKPDKELQDAEYLLIICQEWLDYASAKEELQEGNVLSEPFTDEVGRGEISSKAPGSGRRNLHTRAVGNRK